MKTPLACPAFVFSLVFACVLPAPGAEEKGAKEHRDLVFATVGDRALKLDLFLPADVENPPLVVFIHGGGW